MSSQHEFTESYFEDQCHECDNLTRRIYKTRRCEVRACSEDCATAFESGAGSEQGTE